MVVHGAAAPRAVAAPPSHTDSDLPPVAEPEPETGAVPAAPPAPAPAAPPAGPPVRPVDDEAQARVDAERDAEIDANGAAWLAAGCLLNVYAVIAAYFVDTSPPYGRMIGRSERYLATYMPVYRQAAGEIRLRYAVYGCIGSIALTFGFVTLMATVDRR